MIYDLELLDKKRDSFSFNVHCSKGTYIRTLVEDIGETLGCGAFVSALRRTRIGNYKEAQMISLEEVIQRTEAQGPSAIDSDLLPAPPPKGWVRLYGKNGCFLGLGESQADGKIAPKKLVPV
jgi:tRNA pseudouridine55 synthase